MSTSSRTWKKSEARVAALIGARRPVLSGSSGRDDRNQSDSTHPRIFIEANYRQRHAVRSLFDATKAKKLTITGDQPVYNGLHTVIGRRQISRSIAVERVIRVRLGLLR
jgi:hypothetical protein